MEKAPEFRIVGNASEDAKEQARQEIEKALFNHHETLTTEEIEKLEKLEYPKMKVEKSLIDFANAETNKLLKEYGLSYYNIPEGNYHIVPPDLYNEIARKYSNSSATAFYTRQGIFFNAGLFRANPLYFASSVFHETLHLKGHFSLEVEERNGEVIKTPYREGVSVRPSQKLGNSGKYHEHFRGLHEAIVSTQQKKELPKILGLPVFADEKERLNSDGAKSIRKKVAEAENIPEDDIIWVGKTENEWESVSHPVQREVLDYICSEIQKEFPDRYENSEAVFNEFLKVHFTGRLLGISKSIEQTFGKGNFRQPGNMGTDSESGILCLESLRKARINTLRAGKRSLPKKQL